jgi:H+/Cl- antiporter ClcA
MLWVIPAGITFGFAARVFSKTGHFFSYYFVKMISYPPFRPLVGGVLIVGFVWTTNDTTYIGLGVPRILEAFESPLPWYDWIAKTGLTGITLGSGFKGGEVTPLFFTGATLGNSLSNWIPLPMAVLAAIGFVSIFAGATNTPLACTVMGMELFGYESGVYFAIGCVTAYLASGRSSVYSGQNLDNKLIINLKTGIFDRVIASFKK